MNEVEKQEILTLSIVNVVALDVGNANQCHFDSSGGSIGCGNSDSWVLTDSKKNSINSTHMKVELNDKRFCIREGTGDIYLNSSTMPLGKVQKTIVEDGDTVQLGPYKIRANLGYRSLIEASSSSINNKKQLGQYSLEEVVRGGDVSHESEILGEYMNDSQTDMMKEDLPRNTEDIDDVLGNLQGGLNYSDSSNDKSTYDPIEALNKQQEELREEKTSGQKMDDLTKIIRGSGMSNNVQTQADLSNTTAAAFSTNGENIADDIEAELARMEVSSGNQAVEMESDSVLSGRANVALPDSLGIDIPRENSAQLASVIQDMTETINQAILGLRNLFEEKSTTHDSRLSSLKLHPLEDNPLRLGMSQRKTLDTLYSGEKNPVYLSAGSAVEECMTILQHDQKATTVAIEEALEAILNALSPDTLVQRFRRYATEQSYTNPDAWAWQMYKHYYSELMTNQKNGFNSLFHNVFSQAYDRNIRSLQK